MDKLKTLKKLEELRKLINNERGFRTKREFLSWGAKVEPLLGFNLLYQVEFSTNLGMLHSKLSSHTAEPLADRLRTTLEKAIEQLKHEIDITDQPAPIKLSTSTKEYIHQDRINDLKKKSELHPWRIIASILFDLESDTICEIIDASGLAVDWSLTEEQSYSNKTRKRVYRPRIQAAFDMLSEEEQLQVSWIVASELVQRGFKSKLDAKFSNIGWILEENRLTTDRIDIQEMFFPKGTQHDAYVKIKDILHKSTNSLTIIDPYIDGSIFQMLKTISAMNLKVCLLSCKLPPDFALEANKFITQYPHFSLEIRKTKEFHDRFVILDDTKCYHIGASIKDAGKRAFMISQIEDKNNSNALIEQNKQSWLSAIKFDL